MKRVLLLAVAVVVASAGPAAAKARRKPAKGARAAKGAKAVEPAKGAKPQRHPCLDELDAMDVAYTRAAPHEGIEVPVQITGPLGGVTYETWSKRDLVLDCSLVYSLARAGKFFTEEGMTRAFYSSAYQRRNVRGTAKPSKHSFGLALDVHRWRTGADEAGELSVEDHYEQGLGDEVDCIGDPLTDEGRSLRTVWCRLDRSSLFRFILSPDSDADHYNHFHIEARAWSDRTDLGE
jgi:hypothetical protein